MVLTPSSQASPPSVSVLCSLSHIRALCFVCIPLGLAKPPGWPWGWISPGAGRLSSWFTGKTMAPFPRFTLGSQPTTSTVTWKLFREKAGMIQNLPCFLHYCSAFENRCFFSIYFSFSSLLVSGRRLNPENSLTPFGGGGDPPKSFPTQPPGFLAPVSILFSDPPFFSYSLPKRNESFCPIFSMRST